MTNDKAKPQPVSLEVALAELEARKANASKSRDEHNAEFSAAIAKQRALEEKRDALPQQERRQVLDATGMKNVSAAPKPIEAMRGSGYVRRTKTQPARWQVWRLMPVVKMWQAVALSLNIEPAESLAGDAVRVRDDYSRLPADYFDRLMICKAHLSTVGPIRPQGTPYSGMLSDSRCPVLLGEVAGFLVGAGLTVPDEMRAMVRVALASETAQGDGRAARIDGELPPDGAIAKRAKLLARFRELGGKRPSESGAKGTRGALASLERETSINDKNLGQMLDKAIEEKRRAESFSQLIKR
jgi:hypothetical protein